MVSGEPHHDWNITWLGAELTGHTKKIDDVYLVFRCNGRHM
jgi:hypothetical protein